MRTLAAVCLTALLCAGPASAEDFWSGSKSSLKAATAAVGTQALGEYEAAERAASEAWERLPFAARRAMFVSRKAALYGDYERRPSNVFAPGEPLITYVEPVGFGYRKAGDTYTFEGTIDFAIKKRSGEVLGEQKAFQAYSLSTHARAREFFLNLTVSLSGAPPGDYVLVFTLNDTVRRASTEVEQPFTIQGEAVQTP
ncbi:hypothetical protein [Methylobacterium oxalidis]|uniref:hypothetical protein n=1 Tax=Methylobacterium oxalidis TaxID=944322 RepID=UPI0033162CD9